MRVRNSGILLHVTSLPSPYGIGDLGQTARGFVDFLTSAGQTMWQVLPLNPTSTDCGNSPYCSNSAFAGNPLLISPEILVEEQLLSSADTKTLPALSENRVDYPAVMESKYRLLRLAFQTYRNRLEKDAQFEAFCEDNVYWLNDYALFVSLKERFQGLPWSDWPPEVKDRHPSVLKGLQQRLKDRVDLEKFLQYMFYRQWSSLKKYCGRKKVLLVGDMPIYVSYDSSDVWAHSDIFKLNEKKMPAALAGVPPDYFSTTGQLWGNPVYDWEVLKERRYDWWIRRMEQNLKLFDLIRLDHFRGFVGYWEVPADEKTAVNGKWVETPATDFLDTLLRRFPFLPLIAEDLGTITPDVREVMSVYGFPGMKVLLFAFGDDLSKNPYAPHNHTRNSVVYTGTHDTNTVRGWFTGEAGVEEKERFHRYIGRRVADDEVHWELMRLAMMSVANTAIIPMQDALGLGEESRMNFPSKAERNWEWRLVQAQITPALVERLLEITSTFGRS